MCKFEGAALTERQRYWLEQIEACENSRRTIAQYAADVGISAQAMYAGKKLLVKKGILPRARPARFQRIQVVGSVAANEWHIQLPNGVSVAFSGEVEVGALTTALSTAADLG